VAVARLRSTGLVVSAATCVRRSVGSAVETDVTPETSSGRESGGTMAAALDRGAPRAGDRRGLARA
jgi:hypothetical protein